MIEGKFSHCSVLMEPTIHIVSGIFECCEYIFTIIPLCIYGTVFVILSFSSLPLLLVCVYSG